MANEKRVIEITGGISHWNNSAAYVKYLLRELGQDPIEINISSMGGDVNEALQIKAAIQDHGNVKVRYIGFNASASTLIGHGSCKSVMREDGLYLIHKPSVWINTWGQMNEDQIGAAITELQNQKKDAETGTLLIAQDYVKSRGMKPDKVMQLLQEARWLSAHEAKDLGLIDEIEPVRGRKTEISNEVMAMCNTLGYPLPSNSPITDEIPTEKPAWFTNAFNAIMDKIPNKQKMKKDYQFVNQLLQVEGLEEKNEGIVLSAQQCQSIDEFIKNQKDELENEKKKSKTSQDELSGLTSQLDELDDSIKSATTHPEKLSILKDLLRSRPGESAASPVSNSIGEQFRAEAKDPVNNFFDNI